MKLRELEQAVGRAQQQLQAMELKALNAERLAKTAKAKAKQLKLEHQRAKKGAKEAKRLAAQAGEDAREQCRRLEKAERRLAKARRKLQRRRPGEVGSLMPAPSTRGASLRPVLKTTAGPGAGAPLSARRSRGNGHPRLAAARTPGDSYEHCAGG